MIEKLQGIIGDLAGQAVVMDASSRTLLDVAGGLSTRAENTSERSTSVLGAAEEMTATIGEVAKQSETARRISGEAVHRAGGASQKMARLGDAAAIGSVTEAISEISQ